MCSSLFLLMLTCHVLSSQYTLAELSGGMLYPRESESREIKELNGMWNFRADMSPTRNQGFKESWFSKPLAQSGAVIPMPVPSSYNDITEDKRLRDFVGWVWYDREFYVSTDWKNKRVVLRMDSAHYYTIVWVNGKQLMTHIGGHLPFEDHVNDFIKFGGANRVTVAVNNTLTPTTLPPGTITWKNKTGWYPAGYFVQDLQFDFFNYAGIHRSVRLYTTPVTYIDDITIVTNITNDGYGLVDYKVVLGNASTVTAQIDILDRTGHVVVSGKDLIGQLKLSSPRLWWPYSMMQDDPAYLYTLKVSVTYSNGMDVYRLPFGVRTVQVTATQLLINNKPFYCLGVGKHEDSDIRGKGLDYALIAKDFNMLKWLGVNCFRTSHYPYAEEIMDQADQQGIVVVDESPGVGITQVDNFSNKSLEHHLEVMSEMYRRDKNRPAVIMWSVANEPATDKIQSLPYFKTVIEHTKQLDASRPVTLVNADRRLSKRHPYGYPCFDFRAIIAYVQAMDTTRPVTLVMSVNYARDYVGQYCDVICVNRYFAWYGDPGHTELIQLQMNTDFTDWHKKYNKPMMITEYGADTIVGLHREPSFMFTEEFQVDFMIEYHKAFDKLRQQFLIGEMVWNFADFMTDQGGQCEIVSVHYTATADLCDVVSVNQYAGWYTDTGYTEVIHLQVNATLHKWFKKFKKPLITTEYGAGTMQGLHMEPSFTWSEEYQRDFMHEYHDAFDKLRDNFLVGEMYWNFADYMVAQSVKRVLGNRKGVLTRQRQPKMAAWLLRCRYWSLINDTGVEHCAVMFN